jgi:hypothetical protein
VRIETFSTDNVPAARARPAFFSGKCSVRFSLGLAVEPVSDEPLTARVIAYCGRRLRFAQLEFSPHRTYFQPRPGRRSRRAHDCHPTSRVSGRRVPSPDAAARSKAGQMVVIDPSQPFSIETSAIRVHSIYLQADSVRAVAARISDDITAPPHRAAAAAPG